MFFNRKLVKEIEKYLNQPEIIVLTGMRRVGKTTLLRSIYDKTKSANKIFLDIENPIDQKIFEETDYHNIIKNLEGLGLKAKDKLYIFLDEIQAKPDIVKAIKYLHDHYRAKFFLTGSSSFYLKNLFPESLAGRKIIFELFPLDFEEFLTFKGQIKKFDSDFFKKAKNKNIIIHEKFKKLYDEYLLYGGFPQVVLSDSRQKKKQRLSDIFKSYFEKDVRMLADFKNLRVFRDLMLLLLERTGSKLDIAKLAKEMGVTRDTVYSYLYFLEGTYFIKLIAPYSQSRGREVSGGKKVYICDNGFVSQFSRASSGALLENAVSRELIKYGEVRYYQKRTGQEIDFILKDKKIAFEIKQKGNLADYKRLTGLAKQIKIKKYYIISKEFVEEKNFIAATDL